MKKRILTLVLVIAMLLTTALSFSACSDGKTPQLRINTDNTWEVSYDEGQTWISLDVKATGEDGIDGKDGKDGVDGKNGVDGKDGKDGVNGKDGVDGKDGAPGKDGADGKDGINGTNGINGTDGIDGTDGVTPHIGEDGYWYIGETNTGVYAGTKEAVTVTFNSVTGNQYVSTTKGAKVNFWMPYSPYADFAGWFTDEACTIAYNFNNTVTSDITLYAKWNFHKELLEEGALRQAIGDLMASMNFGRAACRSTTACFSSVHYRVLKDDHKYYDGAADIANFFKGVFEEGDDGKVTVSATSSLRRASYTPSLTVINFASAFSSYEQYILRNDLEMPEDIAAQKKLAIKYFETVDNTVADYHTHQVGDYGMQQLSMGVAVVALGSLMEQQDTARFETLAKDAYEHVDAAFWNSGMYLTPFYQLCAHYDWYDLSAMKEELANSESLTAINVRNYYAYGIDVAKEVPELWQAFVEGALIDGTLNKDEAKAFAYHYAYQETKGDCWLGVYGSTHGIVDFSK